MQVQNCIYCNTSFTPNKYSPRQKVCSNPACQKKRQLESMKSWRESHPNYFKFDESKGQEWLLAQRKRSKLWRQNNPDKVKDYRQNHLENYRSYMKNYMRQYREKKKSNIPNQPGTSTPEQNSTP